MITQLSYSWSRLQPHLDRLNKAALVALVRNLHALNTNNRTFLVARFLTTTPSETAAAYRQTIGQLFNPGQGAPSLQLDAVA